MTPQERNELNAKLARIDSWRGLFGDDGVAELMEQAKVIFEGGCIVADLKQLLADRMNVRFEVRL